MEMKTKLNWTLVLEVGTILVAVMGLGAIYFQMEQTNRVAEATFIMELGNRGSSYINIYRHLAPGGKWSPISPKQPEAISDRDASYIRTYLSFYGELNFLIKEGNLDIRKANELLAGRFFLAVHNPIVQSVSTHHETFREYFLAVEELHKELHKYRSERGLPILQRKYCRTHCKVIGERLHPE